MRRLKASSEVYGYCLLEFGFACELERSFASRLKYAATDDGPFVHRSASGCAGLGALRLTTVPLNEKSFNPDFMIADDKIPGPAVKAEALK